MKIIFPGKYYANFFIILFLTFVIKNYYAQQNPGARQSSIGYSDVALSNDVFSLFNNPAGLSRINSREIGLSYSPSPFGIDKLSTGYIAYNEFTSLGNISIGLMNYGFELYKENIFVLGYSKKILPNFYFGFNGKYKLINIKNYGKTNDFNISLGGIIDLTNNFYLGFSLQNSLRFLNTKIKSPLIYTSGITYQAMGNTYFHFAIIKEINFPISFRLGIEYSIIDFIILRFGIQNEPNIYSGGLGIKYSFLNLDYSISTHQDLGLTHQIGLIFKFLDN